MGDKVCRVNGQNKKDCSNVQSSPAAVLPMPQLSLPADSRGEHLGGGRGGLGRC